MVDTHDIAKQRFMNGDHVRNDLLVPYSGVQ